MCWPCALVTEYTGTIFELNCNVFIILPLISYADVIIEYKWCNERVCRCAIVVNFIGTTTVQLSVCAALIYLLLLDYLHCNQLCFTLFMYIMYARAYARLLYLMWKYYDALLSFCGPTFVKYDTLHENMCHIVPFVRPLCVTMISVLPCGLENTYNMADTSEMVISDCC